MRKQTRDENTFFITTLNAEAPENNLITLSNVRNEASDLVDKLLSGEIDTFYMSVLKKRDENWN
jgi:hypothetical protein